MHDLGKKETDNWFVLLKARSTREPGIRVSSPSGENVQNTANTLFIQTSALKEPAVWWANAVFKAVRNGDDFEFTTRVSTAKWQVVGHYEFRGMVTRYFGPDFQLTIEDMARVPGTGGPFTSARQTVVRIVPPQPYRDSEIKVIAYNSKHQVITQELSSVNGGGEYSSFVYLSGPSSQVASIEFQARPWIPVEFNLPLAPRQ